MTAKEQTENAVIVEQAASAGMVPVTHGTASRSQASKQATQVTEKLLAVVVVLLLHVRVVHRDCIGDLASS